MKNLFFIRSNTGTQSWDYYDSKTEILIFGDADAFHYIVKCLEFAENSQENIHLDEISKISNSMQVVICPAQVSNDIKPILRIIERPILKNEMANMQVVIAGNKQGYSLLSQYFKTTASQERMDEGDHLHLDDENDMFLMPRSVSLNIRSPIAVWDRRKLGIWESVIYKRRIEFLPGDIKYLFEAPQPYQEPDKYIIGQYLKNQLPCEGEGATQQK